MKEIQKSIIFLLCICIIGFFANFAQNDYGIAIVGISLLFIGFLFLGSAYLSIKHLKFQKYLMIYSICCFLAITFLFRIIDSEALFLIIALSMLFIPTLIIPFYTKFKERKQVEKSIQLDYFESVFISYMCMGYFLKLNHRTGASMILITSVFIIIPYCIRSFKLIISSIKNNRLFDFSKALMFLFIGLDIVALTSRGMHWKGSKQLAYIALLFLILLIITLVIDMVKKKSLQHAWASIKFNQRVFLIAFLILSVRWVLSLNNLAPNVYSNEYPKGFQNLLDNTNSISVEGIEYGKKADVYEEFYLEFLKNQEGNK